MSEGVRGQPVPRPHRSSVPRESLSVPRERRWAVITWRNTVSCPSGTTVGPPFVQPVSWRPLWSLKGLSSCAGRDLLPSWLKELGQSSFCVYVRTPGFKEM